MNKRILLAEVKQLLKENMHPGSDKTILDTVNLHMYRGQLQITDTANAGRKGKRVPQISVYKWGEHDPSLFATLEDRLDKATSWNDIVMICRTFAKENPDVNISEKELRGVDVTPTGSDIEIHGDKIYVEATPLDFSVRDKEDMSNEPVMINAGNGVRNARKFYDLVKANQDAIKSMSFDEMYLLMNKNDIQYHHYYAMD